MGLLLLNKFLLIGLIMAILNMVRHLFFIIQIWKSNDTERGKYKLTTSGVVILGLSISYVLAALITGVSI